ncbi:uncharacterized protein LOC141908608 [Tubulanus polymorphus]|uniref:uncharacterized protein LOC141908608 n=1 Tax=Tubulanus polymorphus TaxID=672921 RepID=UPI003DA42E23
MSEDHWPKPDHPSKTAKETAMKKAKQVKANVSLVSAKNADFLESCIGKFKSYNTFLRVMCIVRRWRKKVQKTHEGRTDGQEDPLVLTDRKKELWWISYIQKKHFPEEIRCLTSGLPVSKSSRLKSLDPVWDEKHEIICVGGRLNNSLLPDEQKHPVILPSGERMVENLVLWYHQLYGHTGPTQTLATLRLKYWLLKGVKETMRIIHHCECREPKKLGQKMGQLPAERVVDASPFTHVGCDYAGPLYVKTGKNITSKSYILIFACMTIRAVHLELLEDMTADEFLKSFERMMNRRGKPCGRITPSRL